jgi:hypothetical protein
MTIEIVDHDQELQELIRTKDKGAAREMADIKYELDVSDCDDTVGTFDDGLDAGVALANMVSMAIENGHPDCKIFKLMLDQYSDNDVLTFWVGTRDEIRQRLEALDTDPHHEKPEEQSC